MTTGEILLDGLQFFGSWIGIGAVSTLPAVWLINHLHGHVTRDDLSLLAILSLSGPFMAAITVFTLCVELWSWAVRTSVT